MTHPDVVFLTVDEVLEIHSALLQAFGGASGLRDPGLLESALFRVRTGYYRELDEMAAAMFESLLMNHPFVDGNKRVAFFGTDVFLRMNGWKFSVHGPTAHGELIHLISTSAATYDNLLEWIRNNVERI